MAHLPRRRWWRVSRDDSAPVPLRPSPSAQPPWSILGYLGCLALWRVYIIYILYCILLLYTVLHSPVWYNLDPPANYSIWPVAVWDSWDPWDPSFSFLAVSGRTRAFVLKSWQLLVGPPSCLYCIWMGLCIHIYIIWYIYIMIYI